MKKPVAVGCLILITLTAALGTAILLKTDSKAKAVATRAVGSLNSPDLLERMPLDRIDALLRVEDPSFFDHPGVDLSTPGQGWTTITQGIVKRFFSGPLSGVWGKTRQSLLALALDRHLTKRQQLQVFLETAYFGFYEGQEVLGFQEASLAFFGTPLLHLTREEYIGLVAMLVGPNRYHPLERPAEHAERVARIEALLAGTCEPVSWGDVYLEACRVSAAKLGPEPLEGRVQ